VQQQREPLTPSSCSRRLACFVALALLGCGRGDKSDVDVRYGEAVGIRIEGAHLAPYQVVVAVDDGADVGPLVQPLSSVLHAALLACPSASAPSEVVRPISLSFSVDGGQLRSGRVGASDGKATPGESCLLERLEGRPLSAAALPRHLLLRLEPAAGATALPRGVDASP
jgi:hypothetical protein